MILPLTGWLAAVIGRKRLLQLSVVASEPGLHKALTHHDWTDASVYDLCVNTSTLGLEQAANLVTEIVARRLCDGDTTAVAHVAGTLPQARDNGS